MFEIGSTSNLAAKQNITPKAIPEQNDDGSQQTEVEHDASYISSSEDTSDPNLQVTLAEFTEVVSKRHGKGKWGKRPSLN